MVNEVAAPASGPTPGHGVAEPRTVAAGHGATWWSEGWRLFTPAVGVWLLVLLILIGLHIVASLIPIVGSLAMQVLNPVFIGGLMLGCRAIDRGNPLTLGHLFAGFSQRTGPLVMVGLIYTALALLIIALVAGMMVALFGVAIFGMLTGAVDPSQTGIALDSMVVAALLGLLFILLLLLPLVMAVWFAPALVMLGGLTPGAAFAASFRGCLRNIVPFLLYGVIGLGLAIVASIPFGLGWFVLLPVLTTSVYASYCDIFEDQGPA